MPRPSLFPAAALLLATLSGPALAHGPEGAARAGQVHASGAWARVSPLPGRSAAVFFTLHNASAVADALVSISTPIATRAALHTHIDGDDGVMRMRPRGAVVLAAGQVVSLAPGGDHVMLFGMARLPKPGSTFPLTLIFMQGRPQTLTVRAIGLTDAPPQPAPRSAVVHRQHH